MNKDVKPEKSSRNIPLGNWRNLPERKDKKICNFCGKKYVFRTKVFYDARAKSNHCEHD